MKLKHWIRIAIFVIITVLIVLAVGDFLQVTSSQDTVRVNAFYKEPQDSLDCILVGPSDIYAGFMPLEAYKNEGFTSYSLGLGSTPGSLYPSIISECNKTQSPQLYVVEIWAFYYDDQYVEKDLRRWIDSMRFSANKLKTINEVVPEDAQDTFYFPLLKYHSNYTGLKECVKSLKDRIQIAKQGYSITKGFSTIASNCTEKVLDKGLRVSEQGLETLKEFLQFCEDGGLGESKLLFINTPRYHNYTYNDRALEAIELIKAAGYEYLDMNEDEIKAAIGIDRSTDFYNEFHLSVYGAEKYTDYLAAYIKDNYLTEISHNDEVKKEWDYCSSFSAQIINNVKAQIADNTGNLLTTQSDFLTEYVPKETGAEKK